MGLAFRFAVAGALVALGAAVPAASGHYERSPEETLATLIGAGGAPPPPDLLANPDATVGEAPRTQAGVPLSWYARTPLAPRLGSSNDSRFSLAGGCFRLRSRDGFLARRGEGYVADVGAGDAEAFRFQATDLGSYLLLGSSGRFPASEAGGITAREAPSTDAIWTVRGDEASGYRLAARSGRKLGVGPTGDALDLAASGERLELEPTPDCLGFPEIAVNSTGRPFVGKPVYGATRGTIDLHSHIMAFAAWGQNFHCGRPWHPLGVASALVDCPDHAPNGLGALAANMLVFQDPARQHHPDGWPSFQGWPTTEWQFAHEQTYYRWIERSWRGGMRLLTMLAVDNSAVCLVNNQRTGFPGTEGCNEMDAIRRELKAAKELQAYIDAQAGGPGKGFFRIVRNPFQARRVINRGKLAVILGIETSEPLDCTLRNGVPQCDRADVKRELDAVYRAGVRQMELANKFDNAFSGVAMDGGFEGPFVNSANKLVTGEYWDVETCTGPDQDRTQPTSVPPEAADLIALLPGGSAQLPVYPPPPHCNTKGLSDLGRYAIRLMARRGMIFDPDHMSVLARKQALDLVKALRYSGVVSSHSWADRTSYRRIMQLGGVVTPMAPHADEFDDTWREQRELFRQGKGSKRFGFGFGYADDLNGFGGPRDPTAGTDAEISYPFASPIDRGVRFDRQQSGTKTFDLNEDGVAHFGQWPDWTEGVRRDAGGRIIRDLRAGSESYLRMWERAVGIRGPHRKRRHAHFKRRGVSRIKLGIGPKRLLRRAGQPLKRSRGWTWRVRRSRGKLGAAFTRRSRIGLIAATARGYRAAGIGSGASARRLSGFAERLGRGVWVRDAGKRSRFVYIVRRGRVRVVGVGTDAATGGAKRLARLARLAVGGG